MLDRERGQRTVVNWQREAPTSAVKKTSVASIRETSSRFPRRRRCWRQGGASRILARARGCAEQRRRSEAGARVLGELAGREVKSTGGGRSEGKERTAWVLILLEGIQRRRPSPRLDQRPERRQAASCLPEEEDRGGQAGWALVRLLAAAPRGR
jgi:hypothetical protein